MRDFEHLVRQHVSTLGLPAEREDKIVEEWGAHLGEVYDGLLAEGMTDPEAWSALEHQLPDWERLTGMLADAEPLTARMALPARSPLPGPAKRRLISSLRATLTAGLAGDVRSALRLLAADRTFSAAVILTLAICLGANAAVFTVVHAVLAAAASCRRPGPARRTGRRLSDDHA